ncbi:BZ3500_MvSof-1268-A1-R1_Chr1-3g02195 [Microbotryum saponariae]|uniref:BZ3500_MvSof-1268-A1-R1_Chr1-3g02195 protein n=1 Tax=Microbotryum saponariae TaxID=289078 RepID=A0A2X0L9N0_9BASI|nr:BZ3500_MvSof-1268-A1-R1_Chr1-3g02195 [Microbotryum saponariae]SCZ95621.1 BZ3501_MvSof-1269-A2-R1_Chr1-3g01798 [Microbotryum saponariae]
MAGGRLLRLLSLDRGGNERLIIGLSFGVLVDEPPAGRVRNAPKQPRSEHRRAKAAVDNLTNKYDPSDIFNMDETGLFYAMRPSTGLARNGRNGVKMNKTRIIARHETWNDIRPETIANCWRHAQILSDRKNKGSTDHTPLPNGRGPLNGDRGIINER